MSIPDANTLRRALENYFDVVNAQSVRRLPELDAWYREELPNEIAAREPKHLIHSEIVRLTEWKMARGVWRARNLALVKSNDPSDVEETSKAALAKIPDPTAPISTLSTLKGVGAATASGAASAAAPDRYPFFDELVAEQLPGLGPVKWTLSYYADYADALRAAATELGGEWTPSFVERALWAHVGGKAGVGQKGA